MKKILFLLLICFLIGCSEENKDIIVSFETNGGNPMEDMKLDDILKDGIPQPTKEGFIFVAWYFDESFTEVYDLTSTITSSVTLYARWGTLPNEIMIINFNTFGGSDIQPIGVMIHNVPTMPNAPTKDGFVFVGWYLDSSLTIAVNPLSPITQNQTWYAKWDIESIDTYVVSFQTFGGSSIESQHVENNSEASEPNIPIKEGYDFIGWYTNLELTIAFNFETPITENIMLYAKWEKHIYLLSFESNGGSTIDAIELTLGDQISLPNSPLKTGYTFDGWYVDEMLIELFTLTTMPASNVTLYAKWALLGVTITFESLGGTDVAPLSGAIGEVLEKPEDPTQEGYLFAGWFLDIEDTEMYTFDVFPTESITLYADWGTEGLLFELIEEDTAYGVSAGDAINESTIVIPKYHQGKQITMIMPSGFRDAEYMNVLVLPATLKEIANLSFMYASSLTEVYLPAHVELIGSIAFRFCYSLQSFNVSSDNPYFSSIDGVLFSKDLETLVRYPQNKIGTSYIVPNHVKTIGEDAFSDADNLLSLELGSGVEVIRTHAFFHMSQLASIIIPNQVVTMELYAFRDCTALSSVTIGTGLSSLDAYVFNGCSSLEMIIIPFNITFIGYGAFYDCFNLREIYIVRTSLNGIIQGSLFMLAYTSSNLVIYLPDQQTLNDYKLADFWKSYASKMAIGQPS